MESRVTEPGPTGRLTPHTVLTCGAVSHARQTGHLCLRPVVIDLCPSQRETFEIGDAFGERHAGERMPQVVEGSVGGQSGRRDRGLPDLPVEVVGPQQGSPRGCGTARRGH
jgi:hypothetical protein